MQRRILFLILIIILIILLLVILWPRATPEISINDDTFETAADTAVSGNVLNNDTPTDELIVMVPPQTPPNNGSVDLQPSGEFIYSPAPAFAGSDSFIYQACLTTDSNQCDTATVTITTTVTVNAADDEIITSQNTSATGDVLNNDLPSGQLAATSAVVPTQANGTFELAATGAFTYTPAVDYVGSDKVTYQACLQADPTNCDTAAAAITVTTTVKTVVDAVDDVFKPEKNTPISGNVLTNDSPPGELTASSSEFDLNPDGTFAYTPAPDFTGTVTLNYQACRQSDVTDCDTAVVTFTIEETSPVSHVVQSGEWLLQIARCYGTSPESIVSANYIPYPSWIMPGDVFNIPHVGDVSEPFNDGACIMWYTVQAGDTLQSIATEYNVDLDMLVKANYGCYGYYSYYPYGYGYYGYGYYSPYIYSGCYFYGVPAIYEGQHLVIPVNNENKHLRP